MRSRTASKMSLAEGKADELNYKEKIIRIITVRLMS